MSSSARQILISVAETRAGRAIGDKPDTRNSHTARRTGFFEMVTGEIEGALGAGPVGGSDAASGGQRSDEMEHAQIRPNECSP